MQTELVIFDMAGTTITDSGNVNHAMRNAFAKEGLTISEESVDKVMGYRKIEAVSMLLKEHAGDLNGTAQQLIEHIHEAFNRDMIALYENDSTLAPLPYAEELFRLLFAADIKIALNTGFTRRITDAILRKLDWINHPFISMTICSDEVREGRPHPFMVKSIMEQFSLSNTANVVKVGDTMVDILEGRNAECGLVVAVTTGAYSREELSLYKPDYIIDSLQELPALIL